MIGKKYKKSFHNLTQLQMAQYLVDKSRVEDAIKTILNDFEEAYGVRISNGDIKTFKGKKGVSKVVVRGY